MSLLEVRLYDFLTGWSRSNDSSYEFEKLTLVDIGLFLGPFFTLIFFFNFILQQ
jgi:hypothetical protein